MKHLLVLVAALALAVPAAAQRAPLSHPIDPDLEREAAHNLDVGRQYFKKKAWEGAKGRLEEIVASYEDFTKIDEVYYMLGVCYEELDDVDLARETFQKLVDERPESPYAKKAKEALGRLKRP
jgi:outer membrane protein assembly factor BamD